MTMIDMIIIAIVFLLVSAALVKIIRDRKRGVQCSGCPGCPLSGSCGTAQKSHKQLKKPDPYSG